MPAFVPEDLLLGSRELDQLTAACSNRSVVDPIGSAITTAVGMVDLYTAGYTLTEEHYKRLARALAVYELYRLATGMAPEAHEAAWKAAVRELEGIRDGKFPALARAGETAGTLPAAKAAWGGSDRINIRN